MYNYFELTWKVKEETEERKGYFERRRQRRLEEHEQRVAEHKKLAEQKNLAEQKKLAEQKLAIIIRVKDQNGNETFFKVNKISTKMSKIFWAYHQRIGSDNSSLLRFTMASGDIIRPSDTSESLGLEDQAQINVEYVV